MRVRTAEAHPLDTLIAWVSSRSKVFSQGWGDEALLGGLSGRVSCDDPSVPIRIAWREAQKRGRVVVQDGTFESPLSGLPPQVGTVHVRAWKRSGHSAACVILGASRDEGYTVRERVFGALLERDIDQELRAACVILGASRDEGYTVRERVFGALLERDIDLYFLENPFYGRRRTAAGPAAITVSDHGLMALGMVVEARALLEHLRGSYPRIAASGYSMGGHMAALTAAVSPFPMACAALATGASASSIYTRGLLSRSVDLGALGRAPTQDAMVRERLRRFFAAGQPTHYAPPLRPDAAVIAGCTRDGYVLRSGTERLHQHWLGSTLRWISAGHFSALVTQRRRLCDCIEDAIAKL